MVASAAMRHVWSLLLVCGGLWGGLVRAAEPASLEEVLKVLRAHLAGVSEAELEAAAVRGLLEQLRPRAFLLPPTEGGEGPAPAPLLARTNLFEGGVACLRVGRVAAGLAAAMRETLVGWQAVTNLQGVVLDLRFAGGEDLVAAGEVVDLFVAESRPVLAWEDQQFRTTAKTNPLTVRVAVLVNGETRAAAEALAAALQEERLALLLGTLTAGEHAVYREFPLASGQQLRVAVAAIKVGAGEHALLPGGLTPDIRVEVPVEEERRWVEDPFYVSTASRPSGTRPTRLTEAELVRLHREGLSGATPRPRREEAATGPRVRDPVLVRALDLLKSLAILEARQP